MALYGGFAGTENSRDQRNWHANKTILSGDIDQNDVNTDGNFIAETWNDIQGENAYHVVTGSGTDSTARLDGFIITAGHANGDWPNNLGGGMYNSSSHPTLTNVTFSGGMSNYRSSPTLTNVTFSGGMSNYRSSPTLTNVTFSGNSAYAYKYGGGMFNSLSHPTLVNAILWGNTPNEIYDYDSSANVTYSIVQGGWPGEGNLDADPRFVDAANGNLRLRFDSSAIDAGNNAAVPLGVTTDLDGNPRRVDIPAVPDTGNGTPPIVDMGAYEVQIWRYLFPLVIRNAP